MDWSLGLKVGFFFLFETALHLPLVEHFLISNAWVTGLLALRLPCALFWAPAQSSPGAPAPRSAGSLPPSTVPRNQGVGGGSFPLSAAGCTSVLGAMPHTAPGMTQTLSEMKMFSLRSWLQNSHRARTVLFYKNMWLSWLVEWKRGGGSILGNGWQEPEQLNGSAFKWNRKSLGDGRERCERFESEL